MWNRAGAHALNVATTAGIEPGAFYPADHLLGAHLAAVDDLEAPYDKALRDMI
jgi:hypothetical protein